MRAEWIGSPSSAAARGFTADGEDVAAPARMPAKRLHEDEHGGGNRDRYRHAGDRTEPEDARRRREVEDLSAGDKEDGATQDEEHAERRDDRRDAADRRQQSVADADDATDRERAEERQPSAAQRQREVAVDEGADGKERAGRNVDLAGEDDLVDGKGDDRDDRDLLEDAGEVRRGREGGRHQRYREPEQQQEQKGRDFRTRQEPP